MKKSYIILIFITITYLNYAQDSMSSLDSLHLTLTTNPDTLVNNFFNQLPYRTLFWKSESPLSDTTILVTKKFLKNQPDFFLNFNISSSNIKKTKNFDVFHIKSEKPQFYLQDSPLTLFMENKNYESWYNSYYYFIPIAYKTNKQVSILKSNNDTIFYLDNGKNIAPKIGESNSIDSIINEMGEQFNRFNRLMVEQNIMIKMYQGRNLNNIIFAHSLSAAGGLLLFLPSDAMKISGSVSIGVFSILALKTVYDYFVYEKNKEEIRQIEIRLRKILP